MTKAEIEIWTRLRAEHLQKGHTHWSMDECVRIATNQLDVDLKMTGVPRISLDDLLTKSTKECDNIVNQKNRELISELFGV